MYTEFLALILSGLMSVVVPNGVSPELCHAIMIVESGGNAAAVGDNGKAVGSYQIWPIMVADVNRILKDERYILEDRYSVTKSREMFLVYSHHYAKHYGDWSPEGIARRWNGGGRGHLKAATAAYWEKVRKELRKERE